MPTRYSITMLLAAIFTLAPLCARADSLPLHETAPLAIGMSVKEASEALGISLTYIRGRPGNELLLARPNVEGSALSSRSDSLYLQFRRGGLTSWKGDWGTIRP